MVLNSLSIIAAFLSISVAINIWLGNQPGIVLPKLWHSLNKLDTKTDVLGLLLVESALHSSSTAQRPPGF